MSGALYVIVISIEPDLEHLHVWVYVVRGWDKENFLVLGFRFGGGRPRCFERDVV